MLKLSNNEIYAIALTTLILGLVIGFNDGRETSSIDEYWINNLMICFLAVFISIFLRIAFQKIIAGKLGFDAEFKPNYIGLFLGIFSAFLFNGFAYLFVPGGTRLKEKEEMHIGSHPYIKRSKFAAVSSSGEAATLILLITSTILSFSFENLFIEKMMRTNALLLIYFLIPLPPESDAFYIVFWSRTFYIFLLALSIAISISIFFMPLAASIILSLALGILATYLFYSKVESKS
ncbi:MAG: hypothetical protein PWR30_403 [Candidatus Woesearchaeota archaeon]|nr:hypothetical protein [Candidatus Woesearchaeota archaeon]